MRTFLVKISKLVKLCETRTLWVRTCENLSPLGCTYNALQNNTDRLINMSTSTDG